MQTTIQFSYSLNMLHSGYLTLKVTIFNSDSNNYCTVLFYKYDLLKTTFWYESGVQWYMDYSVGASENEMKYLTSQNTVRMRHTHSISMSFVDLEHKVNANSLHLASISAKQTVSLWSHPTTSSALSLMISIYYVNCDSSDVMWRLRLPGDVSVMFK